MGKMFLYEHDADFSDKYQPCSHIASDRYFRHDEYLLRDKRLCVSKGSVRDLLIREVHKGGLMGHFRVQKTYDIFHKHFYWTHIKHDVHKFCDKCLVCKKAKSKVMSHGLYTPLPVTEHPWLTFSWILF